jgi:CDP-glucose 4,6-dehydratase
MLLTDVRDTLSGRSVLVTGHTGFKGSWLSLWLAGLGARVSGISLPPDQGPDNLFDRAGVAGTLDSHFQDIRDFEGVLARVKAARPEVIFHLAAQPLVRRSYRDPLATFATNIMGTAHVLEAARQVPGVKAVVCVTTDKVYDNREWVWPYRETDALGGQDPYSASKSAAEMVARSYMTALRSETSFCMATARGGNVIGGGDWSEDRLVPDIARAIRAGTEIELRHPGATRPWQHVLELCFGYLVLATRLLDDGKRETPKLSPAYNFGPDPTNEMPVLTLVRQMFEAWGCPDHPLRIGTSELHEAHALRLDSALVRAHLGWRPLLGFDETIGWTARWYQRYCDEPAHARALVDAEIAAYAERCSAL